MWRIFIDAKLNRNFLIKEFGEMGIFFNFIFCSENTGCQW